MDTSNRSSEQRELSQHELVLAILVEGDIERKIGLEDLKPEGFTELILKMIKRIGPKLRYLSHFKSLDGNETNCEIDVRFSPLGVGDRTKCVWTKEVCLFRQGGGTYRRIRGVGLNHFGQKKELEFTIGQFAGGQLLILSDTGELFTYIFKDRFLNYLNESDLFEVLTNYPKVGPCAVEALITLAEDTLRIKEENLEGVREVNNFTQIVATRFGLTSTPAETAV